MRTLIVVLSVVAMTAGCKEQHEPCSGMKFDPVQLPLTFGVTSDAKLLGKVTIDGAQNASFESDPAADPEALARFQADFARHKGADAVTYSYSDHDGESTHFSCGGSTPKGSPEYPGAFKYAIYSDYYEVTE